MADFQDMLFEDDIPTIVPGNLLSGKTLFIALGELANLRPGRSVILNPDLVVLSMMRDPEAVDQLRATALSMQEGGGQVIMPIVMDAGHYVLAVATYATRTINLYDSQPPINNRVYRIVARIMRPSAPGEAPWTRRKYACPRQRNGYDCGVSTYLSALHLLNNPDATDLNALPDMPAEVMSMYWIAGRAAILEANRGRATADMGLNGGRQVAQAERALHRMVETASRRARRVEGAHDQQMQVLVKVSTEIAALGGNAASVALVRVQDVFNS